MTITLQAVNELIASLESAGELSIREQKFLKLAKAYQQLAAENVALSKDAHRYRFIRERDMFGSDNEPGLLSWEELTELECSEFDDALDARINHPNTGFIELDAKLQARETPATDRIVAGIKADGAEKRIAELESRTVKLPAELYTIGELIRTQDNRITDQPMFVVFQKREIIGSDEHSPSRICWVWDGEEVSELRAKRLEALYQDGRDTRGYDRYAMQEVDEFVTACFTEHGCKDYLRQNGHNLRLPYIYACGSFRNNEYQLVRNWLAGIKVEAE
ncbi:TPA: hypothetical protein ACUEUY_004238 [Escherichia coli]|uniref:hypothetical protein n=1 Tax=Escherichia coli TaxID=562 RepID=UPI001033EE5F|nr:hypothetical protein [Escherichia coli]TBH90017.1 hypothetical protein DX867_01230 [Escherichia coli]HCL6698877.1 hypothetical protein [Escherichia coli]HDP7595714.1 hypothetical protein [Escherichia coli]HEA5265230.1 hypothetical protein [Escherichia coli]